MPTKTRSETTVHQQKGPPDLVPDTSDDTDSDEEEEEALTMSPAELRVIRRLAARTNVLPVIAKADAMTDETLLAAKEAVKKGLAEAGLDFGVFGPVKTTGRERSQTRTPKRRTHFASEEGGPATNSSDNGVDTQDSEEEEGEEEEERQSRPVIKLRPPRHGQNLSRSRSRKDLSRGRDDDRRPLSPDATDVDSVANIRFSARTVARTDLSSVMPFAIVCPDAKKAPKHSRRASVLSDTSMPASPDVISPVTPSEEGRMSVAGSVSFPIARSATPAASIRTLSYLEGPPEDLKGTFVRKFRWGTVDVLNPGHCDFSALRTAVLSTHLKVRPSFFAC